MITDNQVRSLRMSLQQGKTPLQAPEQTDDLRLLGSHCASDQVWLTQADPFEDLWT